MERAIEISNRVIPGGWVIGGVTRMLDAWCPSPLVLWAPAFEYPSHTLRFFFRAETSKPLPTGRRERIAAALLPVATTLSLSDSEIYFDARHDSTANVAHILQNHIGVVLAGLEALEIADRCDDVVFIVHEDTPTYAIRLYEVLGFRAIATSRPVSGHRIGMTPAKFVLRSIAARYLRPRAVSLGILDSTGAGGEALFLSRRGSRTLTNLNEVEAILNGAGYRTVYLEDHSAEQQINLVANAPSIFGLHGAALGYVMFRDAEVHGAVVECFSSGYATNWARANCTAVGDTWIGCQGELESEMLEQLKAGESPRAFQSSSYRLSPESVKAVLRMVQEIPSPSIDQESLALSFSLPSIQIDG